MNSFHCLSLSENPVRFEPSRKMTEIFYDDKTSEIFTIIYSNDSMQIIVENAALRRKTVYSLETKKPVISLKFSPDQKILALQHSKNSVFKNGVQSSCFTQCAKTGNSDIRGFVWTTSTEVLFAASTGLELYQLEFDRRGLKFLKCVNVNIAWFLYNPQTNFILVCSGLKGNCLLPYLISEGQVNKLPRLEMDISPQRKPSKSAVLEKDVTLTTFYGCTRVLILQHPQNGTVGGTDMAVYTINKTFAAKKTHTLKLPICGRFALNVVDDLVVVHHQLSKTSYIFDTGLTVREEDVQILKPIIEATPIKPPSDIDCELYSSQWVTFQPNIVIDIAIGAFWYLQLNLSSFLMYIKDKCILIDFLLQRERGKSYLITMLNNIMLSENRSLEEIAKLFNRLNLVYRDKLEMDIQNQVGLPVSSWVTVQVYKPLTSVKIILDQSELYTNVLTKIADYTYKSSSHRNNQYFVWILVEYVRSLLDNNIPVQHCIYELLINTLVLNKCFLQLHQILQYRIIADTKPIACLLLSLENVYPPAHQLALDMLQRISNATEEITEVLLSKQQIISALRYTGMNKRETELSCRKYLHAANTAPDRRVFYSVFVEFVDRNQNDKISPKIMSQLLTGNNDNSQSSIFYM